MPVRKQIAHNSGTYFITFTCTNWMPLFEIANAYEVVYRWFDYLKQNNHEILGYVIMPNHVHVIISFTDTSKSINSIISNGKRFMAYALVEKLQMQNKMEVLSKLSEARNLSEIKANKKHKVFETSFDWKSCESDKFIEQKLQYLHANPCKGKWHLVENYLDYVHSSAKYYDTGVHGFYEILHYKKLEDKLK